MDQIRTDENEIKTPPEDKAADNSKAGGQSDGKETAGKEKPEAEKGSGKQENSAAEDKTADEKSASHGGADKGDKEKGDADKSDTGKGDADKSDTGKGAADKSDAEKGDMKKSEAKNIKELKCELEKNGKALDELNDRYLRLAAEYDNFRKRAAKERSDAYSDAYSDALKEIIPVIDSLELAAKYAENGADQSKLSEGVKLTLKAFCDALGKLGVTEIEAAGKTFDPLLHNAVMHIEDGTLGENTVAEVFQKGYAKGDKVLRHAMVKVAN